jgi:hypothetical protein
MISCKKKLASLIFVFVGILLTGSYMPVGAEMTIGQGLMGTTDWDMESPFIDMMKEARGWWSVNPSGTGGGADGTGDDWETGKGEWLDCDTNGYPLYLPQQGSEGPRSAMCLWHYGDGKSFEPGTYTLLYDGEGEFAFKGDMSLISAEPGKILIDVQPGTNFWREHGLSAIQILQSTQGNHVRNMRLLRPGFDETNYSEDQPFNPAFLAKMQSFSPVRFMGWQRTNWIPDYKPKRSWTKRRRTTYLTQSSVAHEGLSTRQLDDNVPAIEYMIQMCNVLQIEPWFNMPHRREDDYVTNFAQLVKEKLDPNLNVWVEYSNEIWNPEYAQNWWVNGHIPSECNGSPQKAVAYYSKEVWDEWIAVFGDESDRVIRVLAGQHANASYVGDGLDYLADKGGADVASVAGYVGVLDPDYFGSTGELIERQFMELSGDVGWHLQGWKDNMEHANEHNVPLTCYEGGQHLTGRQVTQDAQRDPQMYDLYKALLDTLNRIGISTFVHSSLAAKINEYGAWGGLESVYQPLEEAHKYRAMLEFVDGVCDTFIVSGTHIKNTFRPVQSLLPIYAGNNATGHRLFILNGRKMSNNHFIKPASNITILGTDRTKTNLKRQFLFSE